MRNNFLIAQRAAIITVAVGIGASFVGNVLLNIGGGSNQIPGMFVRYLGLTAATLGLFAFLISSVGQRTAERERKRVPIPREPPRRSPSRPHYPFQSPGTAAARIVAVVLFAFAGLSLIGVFWGLARFGAGIGFGPGLGLSLIGMLQAPAVLGTLGLTLWMVADMTQYVASLAAHRFAQPDPKTSETVMASLVDASNSTTAEGHTANPLFTEKEA